MAARARAPWPRDIAIDLLDPLPRQLGAALRILRLERGRGRLRAPAEVEALGQPVGQGDQR